MIIAQLRRCPSQVQAADQEDLLVHSKVCMNVVVVEASVCSCRGIAIFLQRFCFVSLQCFFNIWLSD